MEEGKPFLSPCHSNDNGEHYEGDSHDSVRSAMVAPGEELNGMVRRGMS